MARVVVTPRFRADTDEVLDYLQRVAGPHIAEKYGRRFLTTIRHIADFPQSGSPRPALGAAARIAIVNPYILIYEYAFDADEVILLRVLHGRRRIIRGLVGR